MSLIDWKIELKLKWTNYCVLSADGGGNKSSNPNNTFFTIKDTKLYPPEVTLSATDNHNYQNFWTKDSKNQFIGMNVKQKVRVKIKNKEQRNIYIFSNQTLLELTDYLHQITCISSNQIL